MSTLIFIWNWIKSSLFFIEIKIEIFYSDQIASWSYFCEFEVGTSVALLCCSSKYIIKISYWYYINLGVLYQSRIKHFLFPSQFRNKTSLYSIIEISILRWTLKLNLKAKGNSADISDDHWTENLNKLCSRFKTKPLAGHSLRILLVGLMKLAARPFKVAPGVTQR